MFASHRSTVAKLTAVVGAVALIAGCAAGTDDVADVEPGALITIETHNGPVEVPVEPARVVALDNTSFETLRDWGITPVAVPKPLLPAQGFEDWIDDPDILDIGSHREPQLELVSEAAPDLIIGGYRFASYQDDLDSIGLTINIAGTDDYDGGWVESLKDQTTTLGEIFNKQAEAAELVDGLVDAEAAAIAATNGETVFLAVVNGGRIDNGAERIGRIIETLDLVDVFGGEGGDIHADSGLAPETIAQANPDWVIVLDRDASAGEGDALPAQQIFDAQEAFSGTTFAQQDQIIYLDPFFYTREGIHAYTEVYEDVAAAFESA